MSGGRPGGKRQQRQEADQRRLQTARAVVARLEAAHARIEAARERAAPDDVEIREAHRRSYEALLVAYRKVRTLERRTERW